MNSFLARYFADYNALKIGFLNRFRKEKTPHEVLTKLKDIQQKKMFVEDYAQKFNRYVGRLTVVERPMNEMLAAYFMNGLWKELRQVVAGVDIATRFNHLVKTATRAKKRFGVGSSQMFSKEDKKRNSKSKKK